MPTKKKTAERYVVIRSARAGCFAGVLAAGGIGTATLTNCRRLWYWAGAASLSQLAVEGTSKPRDCKFPIAVPTQEIGEVIEVIDATPQARESIEAVQVWRA